MQLIDDSTGSAIAFE